MTFPRTVALAALVVAVAACGHSAGPRLREVTLPDLTRVDRTVHAQVREREADVRRTLESGDATTAQRAEAFGRLGMVLHAGEFYDAAEPAYENAQVLDPRDARWPYYLAHLYKSRGDTARSTAAFEQVLALEPGDVPSLIWLGRLRLDAGDLADADRLFQQARRRAPESLAALAGAGQVALAMHDYATAAALLGEAVAHGPAAASLRAPLAAAYRALGDEARAAEVLRQWRNTDVLIADPRRTELDLALDSPLAFELRGVRALDSRDLAAAAGFFRQGAAMSDASQPIGRSLRHKLGTALYLLGDRDRAEVLFDEVVGASPRVGSDETAAKAHYSLGIIAASRGDDRQAIGHFEAAVQRSGSYVEAWQALGDAQRRAGREAAALESYAEALRLAPRQREVRLAHAMTLVRLDQFQRAREALEEAVRLHGDDDLFKHALARLLAAAPDAAVRDGPRALSIVNQLLVGPRTVDLGETTAMALAESGRYDEAAQVQRQIMRAAAAAGITVDSRRLTEHLRLYEHGQASRSPWGADHPLNVPSAPRQ